MDILRRNTDYALRMMVNLARNYQKGPESTRSLANAEEVPYQLACKLMQRLSNTGFVESCMGARGGYRLAGKPSDISILDVIEAIQGPVSVNRCLLNVNSCSRQGNCPITARLKGLQENLNSYLSGVKLEELAMSRDNQKTNKASKGKVNK